MQMRDYKYLISREKPIFYREPFWYRLINYVSITLLMLLIYVVLIMLSY